MEAKDLRVDNWVSSAFGFVKVSEIRLMECTVRTEDFTVNTCVWTSKLQPIPLTEEILLKCKWQLVKGIYFYINSYFCIDNSGRLYYHGDYTGINIHTVHQLQNLYFALTGKELEINL